jgi:hypothetical protein
MDPYTELKDLPALKGSLNNIVSQQHRLKRPSSLSESCAWTDLNLERTQAHFIEAPLTSEPAVSTDIVPKKDEEHTTYELFFVTNGLRFLFHITLISIFETVFFFLYISTLEDSGIQKTIGYFINSVVSSCRNLTQEDIVISDMILESILNTTQIAQQATDSLVARTAFNAKLMTKSWFYVGLVSCGFMLLTVYSRLRSIRVAWKPLILENIGLVLLLAAYEYMFFSTIIFPFEPLSAAEISEGAVQQLQSSCGLLT